MFWLTLTLGKTAFSAYKDPCGGLPPRNPWFLQSRFPLFLFLPFTALPFEGRYKVFYQSI